jgi:hypothetical protein
MKESAEAPPERPSPAELHRLLERGDGEALRRLVARHGEALLRDHLGGYRARLSRRSRRFWEALFDLPEQPPAAVVAAIWPLSQ